VDATTFLALVGSNAMSCCTSKISEEFLDKRALRWKAPNKARFKLRQRWIAKHFVETTSRKTELTTILIVYRLRCHVQHCGNFS